MEAAIPKQPIRVFALWQLSLEKALSLAHAQKGARVVFAYLVGKGRLSSEELHNLGKEHITVVPVPRRLEDASEQALMKAVMTRLKDEERLSKLEESTTPPAVDDAGAQAVAEAFRKLPPVTREQRKQFLDELYEDDDVDDGVR